MEKSMAELQWIITIYQIVVLIIVRLTKTKWQKQNENENEKIFTIVAGEWVQ